MSGFHLAQINIGTLKAPVDAPETAEFVANLGVINALAESQPGFIWRLTGDGDDATDIQPFENPLMAVNMSVWTDTESLAAFVYRTAHRDIMRRRREWFESMELYMCLWWVPIGHEPTPEEGIARLEILRRRGPSPEAFTFREPFPAPDVATPPAAILDECA
ncbi:DUF3291 domain-containing protein [Phenylobacterium aquaticum]|uniref:DUF3291 domain-containing protein n=1 Tax=Phenylobacterium aquaticum TaxID=1763816 RepID=UPI001F5C5FBF|nr:DUF3291 domain-containing protein [Phenylobacterium aquaticum]